MTIINLKRKVGLDSYFINNQERLQRLNGLLLANKELLTSGIVKEVNQTWFIRSKEVDAGDAVWVEATFAEVKKYQKTGSIDFLKEDLKLIE